MRFAMWMLSLSCMLCAETFEEYQERQKAEFNSYWAQEKTQLKTALSVQNTLLQTWEKEQVKASSQPLHRIVVEKPDSASTTKTEQKFAKQEMKVVAVSVATSPEAAKSRAKMAASRKILAIAKEADPSLAENVDSARISAIIAKDTSSGKVKVQKAGKGFVAQVEVNTPTAPIVAAVLPQRGKVKTREYTGPFTGVIVDAADMEYKACLIPVILNADGQQLYGPRHVDKTQAINGLVEWHTSLENAADSERVGGNPLVVRPVRVQKKRRLVLEGSAAGELQEMSGSAVLRRCAVAIVVK